MPLSDTELRGFTLVLWVLSPQGNGARLRTLRSTTVENVLQIGPLFFKTKPILRPYKIQVSSVMTKDYEEKARFASRSKQSQTKPIAGLWPEILSTKY